VQHFSIAADTFNAAWSASRLGMETEQPLCDAQWARDLALIRGLEMM